MTKPAVERTPFRAWLAEKLALYARKATFKEERDPRSPEEKQELADVIRSLWDRCKILSYVPTQKQQWFHDSRTAQVRGVFAPNQRGKTTAGEAEILSFGFGEELWTGKIIEKVGRTKWKPGMRFFIGAKDFAGGHNEVILPKMEELLPLEAIGCEFIKMSGRITHKIKFPAPFSFTLKLLSYDQDIHKSEGMTWNGGWFDEPPPYHLYVSCRRGCLRHAAPVFFTGTPLEEPWMYDDIFAAKDSLHIDVESDLRKVKWNTKAIIKIKYDEYPPGVTKEQIDSWAETLDEDEKAARVYGEFMHLRGRVYNTFSREKPPKGQVLDRDQFFLTHPDWRKYPGFCVVDPHDRKPFAFAWGVLTPRDEIVFVDEWPNFDFARQKQWKWSIAEYAEMIGQKEAEIWKTRTEAAAAGVGEDLSPSIVWRIMDPNFGRTPKAGAALTPEDMFCEVGYNFDTSVDDDVEQGHLVVKRDLYSGRLFFLENCTNTIKAMENYTWDNYRGKVERAPKETPNDKFKDFADLVRYVCKSDLHYVTPSALVMANPWSGSGLG